MNKSEVNGIGAFFYPFPVIVTKKNRRVFTNDEELQKPPSPRTRMVQLIHEIPTGEKILITDDGFVGVFNTNKTSARYFLNTIFATGITYGLGSEILTSYDTCNFVYDKSKNSILLSNVKGPSERTMFSLQRDEGKGESFDNWQAFNLRKPYSPRAMIKLFNTVSEFLNSPNIRQDLILLLEGYTLYYREAYRGAYMYGWMLIETFLTKLWEEHVESTNRSKNDKASIMDNRSWTSYHHIEVFTILGKMSPLVRNLFNALRKKRNNLVHEKMNPNSVEAFWCLRVAAVIIMNRLRNPNEPFTKIEDNRLIKDWNLDNK